MRHLTHDCASAHTRYTPESAHNPPRTHRTRPGPKPAKSSILSWDEQEKGEHTVLNLGFEFIYACRRVLFGIVPARPSILYNTAEPLARKPCQSFRGRPGGWWNSSAVSMQRPCESFRERRSDSRKCPRRIVEGFISVSAHRQGWLSRGRECRGCYFRKAWIGYMCG